MLSPAQKTALNNIAAYGFVSNLGTKGTTRASKRTIEALESKGLVKVERKSYSSSRFGSVGSARSYTEIVARAI